MAIKLKKALPLILFLLVVAFTWYVGYYFVMNSLDIDASSEVNIKQLLDQQNHIILPDWLYPTELRLLNINPAYMLLFKITSNWHTVRYAGIIISQIMLICSYFYLCRQMKVSVNAFFFSAALILLPMNTAYARFVLYHHCYLFSVVCGFLIIGLYLSWIRHRGQGRIAQPLRLCGLCAIALTGCLSGFRQYLATIIPLLITSVAVACKRRESGGNAQINLPKDLWNQIKLPLLIYLFGLAGLYIYSHILSRYLDFLVMEQDPLEFASSDTLRNIFVGYLQLFGFQENRTLFSFAGMVGLGGIFSAVVFLVFGMKALFARPEGAPAEKTFVQLFCPVVMLTVTGIFLLVPNHERYLNDYLPAFIWIFPCIGLFADRNACSLRKLTGKRLFIWLAVLCMAVNGVFYGFYFLSPDDSKQVQYDSFIPDDTVASLTGVIAFLTENGYEVGYSTQWTTLAITELTNGDIPMIRVSYDAAPSGTCLRYGDPTTRKLWREESFVENKSVFMLVPTAEYYLSHRPNYPIMPFWFIRTATTRFTALILIRKFGTICWTARLSSTIRLCLRS